MTTVSVQRSGESLYLFPGRGCGEAAMDFTDDVGRMLWGEERGGGME